MIFRNNTDTLADGVWDGLKRRGIESSFIKRDEHEERWCGLVTQGEVWGGVCLKHGTRRTWMNTKREHLNREVRNTGAGNKNKNVRRFIQRRK
jgi:hypothetical protein